MANDERVLLKDGFVVTCDSKFSIFEHGFVAIEGELITQVGSLNGSKVPRDSKFDTVLDAKNHLIMPGLVSLHFHSDNLSRGVGERMGLEEWLDRIYYPMLTAMEPRHARIASLLAYAEAIKSGTTCVNDMYRHISACADSAEKIGIRAVISSEAADLVSGQESLNDNEIAFKEKNNSSNRRIKIWFGVESIPACSLEFLEKSRELADKYGTGIHIHLNESNQEVRLSRKKYGQPPIELANKVRILGSDCVAAHCVWITEKELAILKKTKTNVSYNPISNMKLGNGIARASEMLEKRINVGLGPDEASSNNTVDMFEVMKFASLAQKARLLNAAKLPSKTVLRMATENGAKALGLGREIGSLEPGKKADLITLNLKTARLTPIIHGGYSNLLPHLVYSAHGEDVDNSIIDGKIILRNRKLLTVSEDEVIENANRVSGELLERVMR
jgi:5-methylthioadenosine/S-adenosylhomocysteine deaminase